MITGKRFFSISLLLLITGCAGTATVKNRIKNSNLTGKLEDVLIVPPVAVLHEMGGTQMPEVFITQLVNGFRAKGVNARALSPDPQRPGTSLEAAWKTEKSNFNPKYVLAFLPEVGKRAWKPTGQGPVMKVHYTVVVFDPKGLDTELREIDQEKYAHAKAISQYQFEIDQNRGSDAYTMEVRTKPLTEAILKQLSEDGLL